MKPARVRIVCDFTVSGSETSTEKLAAGLDDFVRMLRGNLIPPVPSGLAITTAGVTIRWDKTLRERDASASRPDEIRLLAAMVDATDSHLGADVSAGLRAAAMDLENMGAELAALTQYLVNTDPFVRQAAAAVNEEFLRRNRTEVQQPFITEAMIHG